VEIRELGDAQIDKNIGRRKKLTPYQKKPGDWKYRPEKADGGVGWSNKITAHEKLVTKNANRSRKKAYRQQLKKELKDEIQSLS